jgi:hypothetical protein
MNQKEYELAKKEVVNLAQKLEQLEKEILQYENENNRPSFDNEKDLRGFILYAEDGALVDYNGKTYEVNGVEDLKYEYGSESTFDAIYSGKDFEDLIEGNRIGVLKEIK